ncbi:MAG: Xaa-Pro peptidase family protein [Syntrophales bacterium]|jgi:Xaa-Pro aminopeptidase|nr:Xaa-Pro peptidase family protein [Syntrophales bacterium]
MEHVKRMETLQRQLVAQGLGGALIGYSRNIFYYTGTAQPSYLAVLPGEYALFVRSGIDFALRDILIPVEKVKEERRLEKISEFLLTRMQPSGDRLGVELDILTAEQFLGIKKLFPGCDIVNISPLILEQRKTKSDEEIERTREACRAIHAGHEAVLASLRDGITELELAAAVENAHRLAGHEGVFFIRQPDFFMSRGPITSGPNLFMISGVVYTITGVGLSPAVPAGPSQRIINTGDIVIVDIPTLVEGYHADQTRTYCVGKAGKDVHSLYDDLQAIADHLIENIRPGMACQDIYRLAVKKAAELGRQEQFQHFGGGRRSRLIGHGIGLELNEPPIPSEYDRSPVEEDYVIALDMHMLDMGLGVVKLEDMILIKRAGNEILTTSPRKLFEV